MFEDGRTDFSRMRYEKRSLHPGGTRPAISRTRAEQEAFRLELTMELGEMHADAPAPATARVHQ